MKNIQTVLVVFFTLFCLIGIVKEKASASTTNITLETAKEIAIKKFGGQVIEASFDNDESHFEITVLTNTEKVEMDVDANTGQIRVTEREVNNYFIDVDVNDPNNLPIYWARKIGLINGYKDGTFRPNNIVTERQFAKILVNYFKLDNKSNGNVSEMEINYNILAKYGVPLNGYNDTKLKDMAVNRGVVAQAIAYLANGSNNLNESIQYLLQNKITTGQNNEYQNINIQKYFGSENVLTRKQLVTFFYRLNYANITNISSVALNVYTLNTTSDTMSDLNYTIPSKPSSAQFISQDKAIAIAKEKVSGNVTKIELDYDDGIAIYEIEIQNGRIEYDIEIDAITGTILKLQSDYDD
ncbi:PepSY domain-containing protein [Lysinibacillus sp. C5.1]|uniref:PepSY domain-containing protein n=1 Tax=Lysinibacillus sp. C5.1 TaxID=2796169 RepID=UPI003081B8F5